MFGHYCIILLHKLYFIGYFIIILTKLLVASYRTDNGLNYN